jgi:hypothetical protein
MFNLSRWQGGEPQSPPYAVQFRGIAMRHEDKIGKLGVNGFETESQYVDAQAVCGKQQRD